jgi:acyl carrier protein
MSWRDLFKREQLDNAALQALARERFPNRSEEVTARVLKVLHIQFRTGSKYLLPGAKLVTDLGFDDLDFSDMIEAIEKEFAIQIPVDVFEQGVSLDDLITFVEKVSIQQTK